MNNQQLQEQIDQGGNPLTDAIIAGDFVRARAIAAVGQVGESDDMGRSPLYHLARHGGEQHVELARILLNNGANVNQEDDQGDTPLHVAIFNRNLEMAMLLLRHGADPERWPDTDETYPVLFTLMMRRYHGRDMQRRQAALAIAIHRRYGYAHGMDHDIWPLLLAASEGGNPVIVQWLLNQGANPNVETIEGDRPLEAARLRGNTRIANMLIAAGAVERQVN